MKLLWGAMEWLIIVLLEVIQIVYAGQQRVNIFKPCNQGHLYVLRKSDVLYIDGSNGWFHRHCDALVVAGEGCQGVCISITNIRFDQCGITLAIHDSDNWDMSNKTRTVMRGGTCTDREGPDTFCSTGAGVTVRVSTNEWTPKMGYMFEAHMTARAECNPQEPRKPQPQDFDDTEGYIISMKRIPLIMTIVAVVMGTIIFCALLFMMFYCFVIKRQLLQLQNGQQGDIQGYRAIHQEDSRIDNGHVISNIVELPVYSWKEKQPCP